MKDRIPGLTAEQISEAAALREELDNIWPGWRQSKPFAHLPFDYMARLKFCLKRLSLLTGEGAGKAADFGFGGRAPVAGPQPTWGVKIQTIQKEGQPFPIALPVQPTDGVPMDPVFYSGPPKVSAADVEVDVIDLATQLKQPVDLIEELLKNAPAGVSKAAHVRAQVKAAADRDAARKAPPSPAKKEVTDAPSE
jgi:hypothetical protein